jgi:hypothetical protein
MQYSPYYNNPTYVPIATKTLSSSSSTITFLNIPSTYSHLVITYSLYSGNSSSTNNSVYFNGNNSTNSYSGTYSSFNKMQFNGGSYNYSNSNMGYLLPSTSGYPISGTMVIANYTGSYYKSFIWDCFGINNGASVYPGGQGANTWFNNNPISSITFSASDNFIAGTTITIFGVD